MTGFTANGGRSCRMRGYRGSKSIAICCKREKVIRLCRIRESKEHNTWISQPGSGLDKRQCTLQVMVRGDGRQPPLTITFRGKGKRIREDERLAWHPNVNVYFQENAWVDTKTCMDWTNNTLKNLLTVRILSSFYFVITSMHNANVNSRKPYMC